MRYLLISVSCLAAAVAGCGKSEPIEPERRAEANATSSAAPVAQPPASASGEPGPGAIDACSLLTPQEVESIIGEPVTNAQPSAKSESGLDVSQCYVGVTTAVNSISLVVIQKGTGPGMRDPKGVWEETFEKEHADEEAEEGRERKKPEKIEQLGDAAYWIASPIGSALYVLKVNTSIRISVGGAADQAAKLERSKAIARLVLPRL